jgi:hypothetical protein
VIVKIRERLSVRKQASHNLDVERFTVKWLSKLKVRNEYQNKISDRFAALEN